MSPGWLRCLMRRASRSSSSQPKTNELMEPSPRGRTSFTKRDSFKGRLGFARAIILLEEGCDEFSNIQGLGHGRFPQGRISAAFEEVRRVLEREGFLDE